MATKGKPKTAMAMLLDKAALLKPENETEKETPQEAVKSTASFMDNFAKTPAPKESNDFALRYLDTQQCRPWVFADRPAEEMGDLDALAKSIKDHGQQEPVLARPTGDGKYEIIFGNRRWRACKKADCKVLAIVKTVSDKEAAVFQNEENENRKDLSDLARARSYKLQVESGVFKSEAELSKTLGISTQTLNDIMAFNRVPEELINVIPNFKDLSRKTVVKLAVLTKTKKNHEGIKKLANKIGSKKVTAANLESELQKLTMSPNEKSTADVVEGLNKKGKKLFTIKNKPSGAMTIQLTSFAGKHISAEEMKNALLTLLENS